MIDDKAIHRLVHSDFGKAKCLNCGRTWGDHMGIRCSGRDLMTEFQPLGFALSDRCDNCGEILLNHYNRAFCDRNKSSFFEKSKEMFSDKEFLL